VPFVILSSADAESLALETIQDGAENYIVKSSCTPALLCRALRYAVAKHVAEVASRTRVIGVIGAKGGVGATTVACNLATELRVQTGKRVLLADMDVNASAPACSAG
jgi:pilus assembly protein CpaE